MRKATKRRDGMSPAPPSHVRNQAPRLDTPGTVLLEGRWHDHPLLFQNPIRILKATDLDGVLEVLRGIDSATAEGFFVAGALAYEAAAAWLGVRYFRKTKERRAHPLAWFGVYRAPLSVGPIPTTTSPWRETSSFDAATFSDGIDHIHEWIAQGEVYQVNLTQPLPGHVDSALELYTSSGVQAAPYRAWLNLEETQLVSASPELFFRRRGEHVSAQPMKGTAARAPSSTEDQIKARDLASSEKDRAENVMIVDLLRNDLGRVASPGSINVTELCKVETFPSVHQMTSTIEARVPRTVEWSSLFKALFPCGSVTGAPKLRAMDCIRELEPEPRGFYCGAVGFAGPQQVGCFNVAIRTCSVGPMKQARLGVGSGIVWDSKPELEVQECLTKALFIEQPDPSPQVVFETMLFVDGEIRFLQRHLKRLFASAGYFSIPVDQDLVRVALESKMATLQSPMVVRIEAGHLGRIEVSTRSVPPTDKSWRLAVTGVRAHSQAAKFFHKTDQRSEYESAERIARSAGFDEGLLLNERGEVTEGARTSVWIKKDGHLLTPPVRSGLLAGVYRAHVLETVPHAAEQRLEVQDLLHAEEVYCSNAVRGMIPVAEVADLSNASVSDSRSCRASVRI